MTEDCMKHSGQWQYFRNGKMTCLGCIEDQLDAIREALERCKSKRDTDSALWQYATHVFYQDVAEILREAE